MKTTKGLTKIAVVSALTAVVLVIGGVFPTAALSLAALAGLFPAVLVKERGYSSAFSAYLVAGFLSLMLSPDKSAPALFVLLFGMYQIVKQWLEDKLHPVLSYVCKLIYANAAFFFLFFCLTNVFFVVVPTIFTSFVLTWVAYLITFVIYDFAGSEWIKFYVVHIQR